MAGQDLHLWYTYLLRCWRTSPSCPPGNFVFAAFNLLGGNLRHSHVWIPFGWHLSHVLISPTQHQVHHSKARQHWNKNFGAAFALWDWAFGTLCMPRARETLEFGLAGTAARAPRSGEFLPGAVQERPVHDPLAARDLGAADP